MSENGKVKEPKFIAKLVLEYDPSDGHFSLHGNVQDEILTTGMLHLALTQMREDYQFKRITAMKDKAETGIIGV